MTTWACPSAALSPEDWKHRIPVGQDFLEAGGQALKGDPYAAHMYLDYFSRAEGPVEAPAVPSAVGNLNYLFQYVGGSVDGL